MDPRTTREVFLPEDKLKAGMKERIVASLVNRKFPTNAVSTYTYSKVIHPKYYR